MFSSPVFDPVSSAATTKGSGPRTLPGSSAGSKSAQEDLLDTDLPPGKPPTVPPLLIGPGGEEFDPTHSIVVPTSKGLRAVSLVVRPFVATWGESPIGDSMVLIALKSSSREACTKVADILRRNPKLHVETGAPKLVPDYFSNRTDLTDFVWMRVWEKHPATLTPEDIIREIDYALDLLDAEKPAKPKPGVGLRRSEVNWETLSDTWFTLLETHFVLELPSEPPLSGGEELQAPALTHRDRTRHAVAAWFGRTFGPGPLSFESVTTASEDRARELSGQLLEAIKPFWDLSSIPECFTALYVQTKAFFKMYQPRASATGEVDS